MLKPTRILDLLLICVVLLAASWLLLSSLYGDLPPIQWYAGASLIPVAVVEMVLAYLIRARVADRQIGNGPKDFDPLLVARCVALAKASALLGAGAAGVWLGFLVYLTPRRGTLVHAAADWPGALVGACAAGALVAAALWLEHCCKSPTDGADPDADPA